jgi:hypothetical protein
MKDVTNTIINRIMQDAIEDQINMKEEKMKNEKTLWHAIERLVEKLPTWNEDAIIYRHADGSYACDPRSTYDAVAREHKTTIIFECHDLNDIFPGFGERTVDDVDWLEENILMNY